MRIFLGINNKKGIYIERVCKTYFNRTNMPTNFRGFKVQQSNFLYVFSTNSIQWILLRRLSTKCIEIYLVGRELHWKHNNLTTFPDISKLVLKKHLKVINVNGCTWGLYEFLQDLFDISNLSYCRNSHWHHIVNKLMMGYGKIITIES